MKSLISSTLILCLIANAALAQGTPAPQVAAATASAVAGLRQQIDKLPLGPSLTVGQYMQRVTQGEEILTSTLQRAEMVGGPRWLDDQTVQVRLEISGTRVAHALIQIAAIRPYKTPVSAEYVTQAVRAWQNQTFTATGSSTGGAVIERVRPPAEDLHWSAVNDQTRRQAIGAARLSASQHLLDSLRSIQLAGGKTVGQVLDNPAVKEEMDKFLASRPVSGVQFSEDRQVQIHLGVRPEEVFDAFRSAAVRAGTMPADESAWFGVRDLFIRRMAQPTGFAAPAATAPMDRAQSVSFSTGQPPEWIHRQFDAQGNAPWKGSKLRTARFAENDAMRKLRSQLESLPLSKDLTLGAAAKSDPHVADALERTMDRARLYKVDYHEDGSVTAYVSVESMGLWGDLTMGR